MLDRYANCTDCAAHSASSAPPRYFTEMFRLTTSLIFYRVVKHTPRPTSGEGAVTSAATDHARCRGELDFL